jgi:hypothetical protein
MTGDHARYDFNGDGFSDVLWTSLEGDDRSVNVWFAQAGGSFVANTAVAANLVGQYWEIAAVGDFNADGYDDLFWRYAPTGEVGMWRGHATGQFENVSGSLTSQADESWRVVGAADYNGDGRDDLLWRDTSGALTQWLAQENGDFIINAGGPANPVDLLWTVVANGDFNGDGFSDVLWHLVRSSKDSGHYVMWEGAAGGTMVNVGFVMAGASESAVGAGDFNGDGFDDVLTRTTVVTDANWDWSITEWLGNGNGEFTKHTPELQLLEQFFNVAAIGDYNGDGRDDLFWLARDGRVREWVGSDSGEFVHNVITPFSNDGPLRVIQSPDILIV